MGGQKNGMQNIAARTAVRFHDRAGIENSSLDVGVGVLVLNCGFEISFMRIICSWCWRQHYIPQGGIIHGEFN
jgi:hypothetical protein